ncbi:MAG: CocE/NonD family hydrolase [Anaerolineae bacterium]
MRPATSLPSYAVEIHRNVRIPVRDGLQLSADLYLPQPVGDETFPAILEMIPYRKDDWRFNTDTARMSYLAQRGYAGCRLDIRGTGSSPGVAQDEYTEAETRDGVDVVAWLAAQPWCNGKVGMWGISYGGFTAIQVAKERPPALKAIVPMYATDDRYTDDVHYLGGCKTASEMAQYAVSQVAMNALPPKPAHTEGDWLAAWRTRLEATPPWTLEWLRQQTDGPYWRRGSLAPDYEAIACALFLIGGWNDGYTNPVLRMLERCTNAPRRALIGNWVHSLPSSAYPGPNLDWLHEMVRFFDYWLKDMDNGVMDEPMLTYLRREYTEPEAFPVVQNGTWQSESRYPAARVQTQTLYLHGNSLSAQPPEKTRVDHYPHRPTLGTRASLCYGGGSGPNGLARDLRPDEALSLTYTSKPLTEPLDILGFPEVTLYLQATAPAAHVVVRLTDVAPDGTSALVATGILNLTHRNGHAAPEPLEPEAIYPVRVQLKATGYRFLPGQRLRVSIASAWWPVIWPAPFAADNYLYSGLETLSRLTLPVVAPAPEPPEPPAFKTTPPDLEALGDWRGEEPIWEIVEDVMAQTVTVRVRDGDESWLPDGTSIYTAEALTMTAHQHDPADARLDNQIVYRLATDGHVIEVRAQGAFRADAAAFHFDLALEVDLDDGPFFRKQWEERIVRSESVG